MTKRRSDDAALVARRVREFLEDYAPQFLTTSDHTLKAYRDALSLFFAFLQEQGVKPVTLERAHMERMWIERWIVWLKTERGNSPDTCNNRLASLRRFLEYLGSRDVSMQYLYLEAKQVKRQKPAKTKVRGMSAEAVDALLDAPDTTTGIGRRDLTFMTVMYATGARLDEVRSLTAGQVHLDAPKPYVNLVGKGGKARVGYLLPRATRILRAYMKEFLGPDPGAGTLLFPSRVGGGKMSEPAWDKRIKLYASIAHEVCPDVPVGAHAHQLRHAAASEWLDAGMNVVEVQHMLGHEQLSTTMRYLDIRMPAKGKAMAVLESEDDKRKAKKWRNPDGTLVGFLGLGASGNAKTKSKLTVGYAARSEAVWSAEVWILFWFGYLSKSNLLDFLRHTQATQLLANGVDVKTVQARLGHANASVTLNWYAHAVPENDAEAAAVVGNLFAGQSAKCDENAPKEGARIIRLTA